MDRVGIILVNYKNWQDTIECLESLNKLYYPDFLVVVVDNASENDSISKVRNWHKKNMTIELNVIEAEENRGFAAANNLAIKYLMTKGIRYYWLLNNDTVVDSDTLKNLIVYIKEDPQIGFVGSKLLFYNNPNILQAAGGGIFYPYLGHSKHYGESEEDKGQWDKNLEIFYVNGASLLTKKDVIDDIGLMNEQFFMYGEEVEWQIRAKQNGWKSVYAYKSKVYHKVSSSIKESFKKYYTYYYITRNSVIINRKYFKGYFFSNVIFNLIKCVIKICKIDLTSSKAILNGLTDGIKINLEHFYK